MILIIGGAYNGKLDYVKKTYNIKDDDIFFCDKNEIDFSKKVIYGLHKFTYYDSDCVKFIKDNIGKFNEKIIICDDISSGIVPLQKKDRLWRENTGKCLQFLSLNANEIYRIFFGIELVLKNG